ncbi:hypothetical protein Syun_026454 [Stephania yunnanensis]|uniref:Berberine/berberine-like domain-containing protein n=1 Tax=Stephania yunnanensis TaxID=152371 RepID=A0AAP0EU02_9MAGN
MAGIGSRRTIQATFTTLFLLATFTSDGKEIPELGMKQEDCKEMRWVESTIRAAGFPDGTLNWDEKEGQEASARHMSWIRELYDYMTPYVSKSLRTAFLNYKDLDLGRVRINGGATFVDPRIWGRMYFKNNFPRLVKTKSNVDHENFFSGEQTIPPTTLTK